MDDWRYEWRLMWAEIAAVHAREWLAEQERGFAEAGAELSGWALHKDLLDDWIKALGRDRHVERIATRDLIALRAKHGWAMRGE